MDGTQLLAPGAWPAFVLISTRLTGLVLVAPFWSMFGVPRTVKSAVVVALAGVLLQGGPRVTYPDHPLELTLPLATEFMVGLTIGLVAAALQHALTLASEVVALQTGLSFGQLFTGSVENGGPALTQLYGYLGLTVFVALDGHLMLLEGLAGSLRTIPPGTLGQLGGGSDVALAAMGTLFGNAIQVAAPVSVTLTVTNLAMAILSRAVPQLNAMAMAFGISIGLALLMFGAALPVLVRVVGRWVGGLPDAVDVIVGAVAPQGR